MTGPRLTLRRTTTAGLAILCLAALPTAAHASNWPSTAASCSGQRIGKSICLSFDGPPAAPTTVTATVNVATGGRGWGGRIILSGPTGQLLVTGLHTLPAPGSFSVSVPGDGPGQYCGLDQAWDGFDQVWAYQEEVCVTVPSS
ncbi:hypothetical protein [Kitasatospora sp. GAS1066B]|uniref:hypothetical protein n=1 Tax=Kitasatospora sp. GAS1066B TaxID=3156271 RepID=UPI003513E3B1